MGAEAPDPGSPITTIRPLLKVMIVAGEASGDKHGAALAQALVDLYPNTRFEMFGSGGDEMRRAGVQTLVDARQVAIIGIPEIIRALGRLLRAYRDLVAAARKRKPDVVVLVDWPDFNLRLARRLHREGFKIAYYISPQVWAWRRYRVKAIKKYIDRMLVILPFEEEFYKQAGSKSSMSVILYWKLRGRRLYVMSFAVVTVSIRNGPSSPCCPGAERRRFTTTCLRCWRRQGNCGLRIADCGLKRLVVRITILFGQTRNS